MVNVQCVSTEMTFAVVPCEYFSDNNRRDGPLTAIVPQPAAVHLLRRCGDAYRGLPLPISSSVFLRVHQQQASGVVRIHNIATFDYIGKLLELQYMCLVISGSFRSFNTRVGYIGKLREPQYTCWLYREA